MVVLSLLGCNKQDQDPCMGRKVEEKVYMPDTLYSWFENITPRDSAVVKNFKSKSNTGLTESMQITRNAETRSTFEDCLLQTYQGTYFSYESSLYGNYFNLSVDFANDDYPNGWEDKNSTTSRDKIDLKIHYAIATDTNNPPPYIVDLVQPVYPAHTQSLQAIFFTHAKLPAYTQYVTCDTCIKHIGAYTQNGRTYTDVWRYYSPIGFGKQDTPNEFLIDKKYGIIWFKTLDNTSWEIDVH